jgi:GNAT superfamily N-acetyltransferase
MAAGDTYCYDRGVTEEQARCWWLSFMVDPAHAGRGVGRTLGEHVIGWARAQGYRAMQFNAVVETNTRAVSLWRSLGFQILATVPEAFHHPVHGYVGLHVMHRRL